MITIDMLKKGKVGEKVGGFSTTIKTCKKITNINGSHYQDAVIMDETGEMLATFLLGKKRIPLQKCRVHNAICEVRENFTNTFKGNTLYISQFQYETQTVDEFEAMQEDEELVWRAQQIKEIRGKIKCLFISSKIRTGAALGDVVDFAEDPRLTKLVDITMEG